MKKIFTGTAIALIGFAAFSGCIKISAANPSSSMKATINGAAFNATNCIATTPGGTLTVNGSNNSTGTSYANINIGIFNYTGVGTYAIPGASGVNFITIDSSGTLVGASSAYGAVTITSVSSTIIGTFSFTALDSDKVTGGTFTAQID